MTEVIIIPGLGGSGPNHWQSLWKEHHSHCQILSVDDWNMPDKEHWLASLEKMMSKCISAPLVVAHSLGGILFVHWVSRHKSIPIKGALLVAPPDVDDKHKIPAEATCFAPIPMTPLPFPSIVVASENDSFASLQRSQAFAVAWGADFVNVGRCGHINSDSHLKDWNDGWKMLNSLNDSIENQA